MRVVLNLNFLARENTFQCYVRKRMTPLFRPSCNLRVPIYTELNWKLFSRTLVSFLLRSPRMVEAF